MATVWLTYAWKDNQDQDIDFLAQELATAGVTVRLDRWTIGAGRRLWEQIEESIVDQTKCDAWALVATPASLGSEACREEFSFALDRALGTRGGTFPIIALFNGPVDSAILPASLRVRLCVSTAEPNWKERVQAAAEGRTPNIARNAVDPYLVRVHENACGRRFAIEFRPRAGVWAPFLVAIPITERVRLNPTIMHGPTGRPVITGILVNSGAGASPDGHHWILFAGNEATPTQSYYLFTDSLPTTLTFGVSDGQPLYRCDFRQP